MESTVKPCFIRLVQPETNKSFPAKANSKVAAKNILQRISTTKWVRCQVCNKPYKYNSDLEVHIRVHTGERPFGCSTCNKKFKTQYDVTQHSSTVHIDKRPFLCIWCDKSFKQSAVLVAHLRMHTKEKPFFCKKCPLSFSTSGGLAHHALCEHNSGKGRKCEYCSKVFYTTCNLERHRRIHTGDKPYSCAVCGKSFAQKSTLNQHSRVHSESRPFKYKMCPKVFRFQNNLKCHILSVHEKMRPFPCEICGKAFFSPAHRDTHINSHLNEKPFLCSKCPKRYAQRSGMVYHLKAFHENKRDFKCSECLHFFVDKKHLDLHFLKIHADSSDRPFACLFCSKKYCKPSELENHLGSHLGEKPYFCQICHFSSGLDGNLKKHVRSVHKACIG